MLKILLLLVTVVTTINIILKRSVSATAVSRLSVDSFEINGTMDDSDIIMEIINNTYVNLNITVKQLITSRILINAIITSDSDNKTKVITKFKNFDYCRMTRDFRGGLALKILNQSARQKTFITSCPIQKGFYYLKNHHIDPDIVPFRFVPTGKYLFSMNIFFVPRSNINKVVQTVNFFIHVTLQRST